MFFQARFRLLLAANGPVVAAADQPPASRDRRKVSLPFRRPLPNTGGLHRGFPSVSAAAPYRHEALPARRLIEKLSRRVSLSLSAPEGSTMTQATPSRDLLQHAFNRYRVRYGLANAEAKLSA